jgi:hypothetical protein
MTTLHSPIPVESHIHSGYTLKGIGRNVFQWGGVGAIIIAFVVFVFIAGINYQKAIMPDITYLQDSLRTAYADNNRAQSAMAAQIDWVDDSSYRTGWRDACVAMGQDEDYCYNKAMELVR